MLKRLRRYKRKYIVAQRAQARKLRRAQKAQTRRFNRIRSHPFVLPIAFLIVSLGGFSAFILSPSGQSLNVNDTKIVIITDAGKQDTVPTKEPTVGALLHSLAITIHPGDVVEPNITTPITQDDFRINIYRGQPVEVVVGDQHTFAFSAATTPRAIAQQAGITVYPEDYVSVVPTGNFLTDQAIGERVVIDRAIPVNINIFGTQTVIRTHDNTVGELLADKHIVLGSGDSVVPDPSTAITTSTQIFLIHKGTQIITVTQSIPMTVQAIQDSSLAYGTSAVVQQGSNGTEVLTYQVNLQNGQPVSRTLLQTVVTQQPVTEIVNQGTSLSGIKGDMSLAGIAPEDYQYADYIITHESGWCTDKLQGDIGYCPVTPPSYIPDDLGYGLCQATPGSKMSSAGADWETDPVTQLEWCNGYATSKYGGWYNAYLHWTAYGNW